MNEAVIMPTISIGVAAGGEDSAPADLIARAAAATAHPRAPHRHGQPHERRRSPSLTGWTTSCGVSDGTGRAARALAPQRIRPVVSIPAGQDISPGQWHSAGTSPTRCAATFAATFAAPEARALDGEPWRRGHPRHATGADAAHTLRRRPRGCRRSPRFAEASARGTGARHRGGLSVLRRCSPPSPGIPYSVHRAPAPRAS